MEINVWRFQHFSPRYYLTHPWQWLKDFALSVHRAWQRSVRGYADSDWFELCDWMIGVLAPMFDDYAEHHFGYPGEAAGFTDQQWTQYLRDIARHLRNASEDQTEQVNEFEDEWRAVNDRRAKGLIVSRNEHGFTTHKWPELTEEQRAIQDRYFNRELEIVNWREQEAMTAMKMIGEHFLALWD